MEEEPTAIEVSPGDNVPEGVSARTDLKELKRQSVRGGMATMFGQGMGTIIQLTSTVVLGHLLSPDDYGIVAMVMTVTSFAGLFGDLGLSVAAIQAKDPSRELLSNLFWMNALMGLAMTVLVAVASPLIAWFYQRNEVLWVTLVLSLNFAIASLGNQQHALLVKRMLFGKRAVATITGSLLGLLVSISLAWLGWSYWALVWGSLATCVGTTAMYWIVARFRPCRPSKGSGIREMMKFGAHVTAFDIANYFHRNLDNLLIGRHSGTAALGLYSRAYSLLMFPINNLRSPINAVAFPAMTRLQNEPEAFRAYYRQITSLLAFLSMPLTAFLFLTAAPVVEIALGRQWSGVVPIFAVLALVGFIQPAVTNWGVVLLSLGRSKRYLRVGIWNSVFSAAGFLGGLPWGPVGVASGYAAATYATLWPILRMSFVDSPVSVRDFFSAVTIPATASVATVGLLFLGRNTIPVQTAVVQIAALGIAFVVLYPLSFFAMPGGRQKFFAHIELLTSIFKRSSPPAAGQAAQP